MQSFQTIRLLAGGLSAFGAALSATLATAQVPAPVITPVEEIVVVAEPDRRTYELAATVDIAPDSAALLRKAVGANVVSNGPLTGMAQYRGMSRFRVGSNIDGAVISPGGPNWMDPPLAYAPAALLESLDVYRGIVPVSAGQESIGGMINANTWSGEFGSEQWGLTGRIRTGTQSINHATLLSGAAVLSNQHQRLKLAGLTEQADDAAFASGDILPTEYQRDRFDFGYSVRQGQHTARFDYGRNETGDAGTPALPMDIQYIDSDLYRLGYQFDGSDWSMDAWLYHSDIAHGMTNYHLRTQPSVLSRYRRNIATADNDGFGVSIRFAQWHLGFDGHREQHNSDIDNPQAPMFFVDNFNQAQRRVLGAFIERNVNVGDAAQLELGLRMNHIAMDADTVNATPAAIGMPPAVVLRDQFNNADRSKQETNVDWVAKLYVPVGEALTAYAGAARKSRAPSYQERYLWLPLQATAGLADGLTYTGNLDLDSEVAHELELGFDWQSEFLSLAPRLFYRSIKDYIQGTPGGNVAATALVMMMNNMNGTSNPAPLQFSNVDAVFYGLDIDWRWAINERWSLAGALNLVRGERDDIDDDLYRVTPHNVFVNLSYARQNWGVSLESFGYRRQDQVSDTNLEQRTSGYALFNLQGYWNLGSRLKLGFGVDNLTDRTYREHLGGVNRVTGNPDIAPGQRLPGFGRSFFTRLDFRW